MASRWAVLAWKDYCIHRGAKLRWDGSRTGRSNAPITAGATTRLGSALIPAHPMPQPPIRGSGGRLSGC